MNSILLCLDITVQLDRKANHTDSRKVVDGWKDNLLFNLSMTRDAVTLQRVDGNCAYCLEI